MNVEDDFTDEDDTKLRGSLQTLVDMLEDTGNGEGVEDDDQTNEVIGKIMNLVTKMVDEEEAEKISSDSKVDGRASNDFDAMSPASSRATFKKGAATPASAKSSQMDTPGSARSGSGRRRRQRRSPQTELPHYPTPYELWQKSHQETHVETVKEKVAKLSKAEKIQLARDVTDRLLRKQREEHFAMMKKQHKKLANELRGLTFVPNLSRTEKMNQKLVQSYEPLYKRYNYVTEIANIKRTKMEQQRRTADLIECSFKPDIRQSMERVSPKSKEGGFSGKKVEDRCIQYGEEKQMWAQQRREIIKRIETQSLTFSPSISSKSSMIVEEKKLKSEYFPPGSEGRVHGDLMRKHNLLKKREAASKGQFSPKINHRSEKKAFRKPVYERLYAMAKKQVDKKRDLQAKFFHEKVRNVPAPLDLKHSIKLPEEYEKMGLSEEEKQEIIDRMKRLSDSKDIFCPRRYVNVVEWDPKYSFIASKFSE